MIATPPALITITMGHTWESVQSASHPCDEQQMTLITIMIRHTPSAACQMQCLFTPGVVCQRTCRSQW
jgi:hypothetical protein